MMRGLSFSECQIDATSLARRVPSYIIEYYFTSSVNEKQNKVNFAFFVVRAVCCSGTVKLKVGK